MATKTDLAKILIVDDLREKCLAYCTILEELGEELVEAHSGADALKLILRHDFAVVLLDVNMPIMNGFETAHLIRQRRRSAHTPIIFLTAFADEVQTAQGYAIGGVDYIATPVIPEILRAKVRVFVELFRMRQRVAHQAEDEAKRRAAEESARRSRYLLESSRVLANSLDWEATLKTLVRLPIPTLAELSLVALADDAGEVGPVEFAWLDRSGQPLNRTAEAGEIADWFAAPLRDALRSGQVRPVPTPSPSRPIFEPRKRDGSPQPFELLARSVLLLPLAARGRTIGVLTLVVGPSREEWVPTEVALAQELSISAGVALDNSMLVRDIQESDRRKNEFLAMLSHELRNPLASVRNALSILEKGGDRPRLDWARDVIGRQVKQLSRLIDDLLDVARITGGKIRFQLEPIDVARVVHTAVETATPDIEKHGHKLTVRVSEGLPGLRGDSVRLAQVLSNLLNNAAKYTPGGGEIALLVEAGQGEVMFRVRDNGAGIRREMLRKIFDLFSQEERSLVSKLVEIHGGSVEAFSEGPDRGSEFVVRIPVEASAPPPAEREPNRHEAELTNTHRVLVVDDNTDAADSLALLLQMEGHEVKVAYSGLEAIEAAGAFRPETILLDIGLPGLDGYAVALKLRQNPVTAEVLLIAVSGYGQDDDRARSREAGFNHHLTKPVEFSQLRRLLLSPRERAMARDVS
jgi:CheY-like chemotaxis protein